MEYGGLPVALRCPLEMADLASSAAEAMLAASAMHLSLRIGATAANVMHEVANTIEHIRSVLGRRLSDPDYAASRLNLPRIIRKPRLGCERANCGPAAAPQ